MRTLGAKQLACCRDRHAQGGIVISLGDGGEEAADSDLDCVDSSRCGICQQYDPISNAYAEIARKAFADYDAQRVIRGKIPARKKSAGRRQKPLVLADRCRRR